MTEASELDDIEESAGTGKKPQGRSEIAFPYASLDEAVDVAKVIYENGAWLFRDQIEGYSKFANVRMRLSAARMFGLITESDDGKFGLTDLGNAILSDDDVEARIAKRNAFKNIPLYQKTHEIFRGRNLPSRPDGLENAFVSFGVVAKQKDRARLAFERSAQFAGFFDVNKDRLVEPVITQKAAPPPNLEDRLKFLSPPPLPPTPRTDRVATFSAGASEFLVKGLLDIMPVPGEAWSLAERARWLRALAVNLSMLYGEDDDGEIEIKAPTIKSKGMFADDSPTKPTPKAAPKKVEYPSDRSSMDIDDEIPF